MNPAPSANSAVPAASNAPADDRSRLEWLAALVAFAAFFGRYLVPAEASDLGNTLLLAQASCTAAVLFVWAGWRRGALWLRLGWLDVAVLALAAGPLASLAGLPGWGNVRAGINVACENLSVGIGFVVLRQLLGAAEVRRAFVLCGLSLTAVLAGYGVYQRFVEQPGVAKEYMQVRTELDRLEALGNSGSLAQQRERAAHHQALRQKLMKMGVDESALSGGGRKLLEFRLLESNEPLGLFALANTFAGVLVGWLVVWFGAAWSFAGERPRVSAPFVLALIGSLVVGCVLVLTKSRTAYVGLIVGATAAGYGAWCRSGRRLGWKTALAVLLGAASLLPISALVLRDRFVLTETGKSLRYRLEYWQGTWAFLAERPWTGAGPGAFREAYLQKKLPQSSEEIADPHNMFLDAWSSGGLLSLCGLAGVVLAVARQLQPGSQRRPAEAAGPADVRPGGRIWFDRQTAGWGTAGFALAFAGVFATTWGLDVRPVVLGLASGVLLLFLGQVFPAGTPSPNLGAGAAAAICTHLAGAGGIGMPAVAQTLLALLACATVQSTAGPVSRRLRPAGVILATAGSAAAWLGLFFAATRPSLLANSWLERAHTETGFERRVEALERAAAADPFDPRPWDRLADEHLKASLLEPDPGQARLRAAISHQREALVRNPSHFGAWRRLAQLQGKLFQQTRASEAARSAAESLEQAVRLYPHHAALLAELADAYAVVGDERAGELARRALDQDEINRKYRHSDKYLPEAALERLRTLLEPAKADPAAPAPVQGVPAP